MQARERRAGVLGVVALLLAGAIVYVAYNALNGLPFESRYHVTVELPDASRLIPADDVRIGGVLVGQISSVEATPATTSRGPFARIGVALDGSVGHLPVDSTAQVRSASPLGATYLELTLGRSRATLPEGGTLPLADARRNGDLVDLFQIFDRSAARHFQGAVSDLSDGLAGRGSAVNTTIGSFSSLLPWLTNVAGALSAPRTRLGRFLGVYAKALDGLAPVSAQIAGIATRGAITLGALATQRPALGGAIELAPSAERSTTAALTALRPALARLENLTSALAPAVRRLPAALTTINQTLTTGTPGLGRIGELTDPLGTSLATVTAVARRPSTDGAVRKLSELLDATNANLDAFLPAQMQCNIFPLFFQTFASFLGLVGVGQGPSMLFDAIAQRGAQTDGIQSAAPSPDLHANYLPHENYQECEAGNEPYSSKTHDFSNPPGLQPAHTRETTPPPHVLELARSAGLLSPGGR